jgi:anti-sigma regulatory factor (Ser/Thr protein kinase)
VRVLGYPIERCSRRDSRREVLERGEFSVAGGSMARTASGWRPVLGQQAGFGGPPDVPRRQPGRPAKSPVASTPTWQRELPAFGLDETAVWEAIKRTLKLDDSNAVKIVGHAFTKMLNNAIEHSESETVAISWSVSPTYLCFEIADNGVGVYEKVRTTFGLDSVEDAVGEVSKGQRTSAADKHTGEGIFFTSITDVFAEWTVPTPGDARSHDHRSALVTGGDLQCRTARGCGPRTAYHLPGWKRAGACPAKGDGTPARLTAQDLYSESDERAGHLAMGRAWIMTWAPGCPSVPLAKALGARDGLAQAVQVPFAVVEPGGPFAVAPG